MSKLKLRIQFEEWATDPPREWETLKNDKRSKWPGQYFFYHVECAWQAWLEASRANEEGEYERGG